MFFSARVRLRIDHMLPATAIADAAAVLGVGL
jgi:hypothetical protein